MQEDNNWLTITDDELSAANLEAEVENRVQKRRETMGEIQSKFPDFGVLSPMPEVTFRNAALAHHLRLANEMEPLPAAPNLAPSPATRVPVLGKLWEMVRGQFHELILFYVNRTASHETKLNNHLISSLNELTRIVQEQQEEIDQLREEVHKLEERE